MKFKIVHIFRSVIISSSGIAIAIVNYIPVKAVHLGCINHLYVSSLCNLFKTECTWFFSVYFELIVTFVLVLHDHMIFNSKIYDGNTI